MLGCSEERVIQELGVLQGLIPVGQHSRGAHGALCLLPQLPQPYAGQGITGTAEPRTSIRDAGPCQQWSPLPAPRNPPERGPGLPGQQCGGDLGIPTMR